MLEKACCAVEKAANGGGVYPEVMFEVARHWYHLFEKHAPASGIEVGVEEHPGQHEHVSEIVEIVCALQLTLDIQPFSGYSNTECVWYSNGLIHSYFEWHSAFEYVV